jgi:hypothetical protein
MKYNNKWQTKAEVVQKKDIRPQFIKDMQRAQLIGHKLSEKGIKLIIFIERYVNKLYYRHKNIKYYKFKIYDNKIRIIKDYFGIGQTRVVLYLTEDGKSFHERNYAIINNLFSYRSLNYNLYYRHFSLDYFKLIRL